MKRFFNTVVAALAVVALTSNLQAQSTGDFQTGDFQTGDFQTQSTRQSSGHLRINPQTSGPRLGMMGISTGRSVEVYSVNYGSAAERLGLETGDRILRINGHEVTSVFELQRALRDAANFHGGQVSVLVDNVRARRGEWDTERYVTTRTYLDGFMPSVQPLYGSSDGDIYGQTPQPAITATAELGRVGL